ncbi:MAG: ATP-binding cassette domain-containing protein [Steroidobacteraceae bacterium]
MRRSGISAARYVEVRLRHLNLRRQERAVLNDVSWTIRPGQRWVLAGGNGAGKTQLLKLISGAVWPTPDARLGWRLARRYRWRNENFLSPLQVKEEIGYVGPERQDKYERYAWNHTVEQIVGTGLHRTDIPLDPLSAADRRRIAALLARVAIEPLAQRGFLSLSYGERRLTLLARALASRPKLLLLDELLSGLDELNHARAMRWLQRTSGSSLPWVLATHRLEDVPASATHALVLDKGRVVYKGVLCSAPLRRWLRAHESSHPPSSTDPPSRSAGATTRKAKTGRFILRLSRASVYLDEHKVLGGLSFEIHSGECWVVHGRNGSGKTTLLRTLYGDYAVASGGRLERAGIESGVALHEFKRKVGLVAAHLQSDHPRALTVAEVVQSGRQASIGLNDAPKRSDRLAATRSLEFFGLSDLAAHRLWELSYGQLRRVLFARAWACSPKLLLLDEPFAGVDTPTRLALMALLPAVAVKGTAVVMTTHHRTEWPACTTHELALAGGRALYCGPVRSCGARSRGLAGGKN